MVLEVEMKGLWDLEEVVVSVGAAGSCYRVERLHP